MRTILAPYLARTLPSRGELPPDYYGAAHQSFPNYVATVREITAECGHLRPMRSGFQRGHGTVLIRFRAGGGSEQRRLRF